MACTRGKRVLAGLMALGLLWGSPALPRPALCAAAEETAPSLEISVTAQPDQPAAGDEIDLTFTVLNRSDERVEGMTLSHPDGFQAEVDGTLEPNGTLSFHQSHTVTDAEAETGKISYLLTCRTASGRYGYAAVASLTAQSSDAEVEFLRRVSPAATRGGAATLIYQVSNVGGAAATSLRVTDSLGAFSSEWNRLEPGETKTLVQRVALAAGAVSAPVLEYSQNGLDETRIVALDALDVPVADESVTLILTAGRSMFESDTAEVTLRLSNVGNTDYPSLTIYDDVYGGIIADAISLPAGGETVEITHSYPIRENERYCWRVEGVSSAGTAFSRRSNEAEVPKADAGEARLKLTAEPKMAKISRRGYVPVTLTLTNDGSGLATKVRLSEETLGELTELAVVAGGEPTVYTVRVKVSETTTYRFRAEYLDGNGRRRTASAAEVEIAIGAGGERPEGEKPSEPLAAPMVQRTKSSDLYLWLLAGACAVLLALSVGLMVSSRRARRAKKERAAARRQRVRENLNRPRRREPTSGQEK